jgi:hypothetical protein
MIETQSRNQLVTLAGVAVTAVVILAVIVLLPPFRLLNRLQDRGYTSLTPETPTAAHQDGIQIGAIPDDLEGNLGVKLDSVPRLIFLEGSAGKELKRAAESLPANLVVKSPFYKISTRGKPPDSTTIALDIPNNAEPWETLDLYTWTGKGWQWVGGQVDTNYEMILAHVGAAVPSNVVVMQADTVSPAIFAQLSLDQSPSSAANSGVTHLLLLGLLLGDRGGVTGDPTRLPLPSTSDGFAMLPSLRNWSDKSGSVNQGLLADLLASPQAQQVHIDNLVALAVAQGYAGIDLDYRGVRAEWRDAYSDFVTDLANTLHEQGKMLSVAVEALVPSADGGGWDTGGYDWRALGQAADALRAPYDTSKERLAWAFSQVSRYKFVPTLPVLSSDQVGSQVSYVNLETALAPLGGASGPNGESVSPGEVVQVSLSSEAIDTLQHDESSQTYRYAYHDEQGVEHQVTVVTAASLANMLNWASRYHLGGVLVAGMLEPEGNPSLTDVVRQFAAQSQPTASDALEVVWTVRAASGKELVREDRPLNGSDSFAWTAPQEAGEYVIGVSVASRSGVQSAKQGTVSIKVATPTPTGPPTPTPTPTPDPNQPTPTAIAVSADCLNATYVADVTVPDHTRYEKNENFVKTWRVRNNGSCAWPDDAKIVFVSGSALSAPQSVNVGALEAGGSTDVSVDMAAPDSDGSFTGVWRMADGAGTPFGGQLTVVIKVGEEPAAVASAPVVAPAGGGGFELGGHYRSWNYVSQMKYAGMTWAKTQVHYGQDASGIIQTANANGLKIQLSALGTPDMVLQPNFHADYSAWVANMARAGAHAIEVWNEPNINREWADGHISPASYTQLLCAAYNAIKAANPNTLVISAAPAPTGWYGGCGGGGCDDQPWMEGMAQAGAANCMDYIGAHHNAGATSPSASSGHPADGGARHHSWYFLPQTQLYYNIFGGSRKIFYTEMGYASQEGLPTFSEGFAWARGITNAQQAAWLAEAVNLGRSTGTVYCIIVWNIDFVRYGDDPQDGYAIIRAGGGCPACDALRNVMQ